MRYEVWKNGKYDYGTVDLSRAMWVAKRINADKVLQRDVNGRTREVFTSEKKREVA